MSQLLSLGNVCNQFIKQCLTQVQTIFGDIIEECKDIRRSSRELQTHLEEPMLVRLLSTCLLNEPSDLSHGKAYSINQSHLLIRPSHKMTTNPINEVIRTMKKNIIITLLTLTLLGGLFMSVDMSMFTSLPIAIMGIFNWRKRGNDDNIKTLPEAHNGLRDSDTNKEHYINTQVEQVDKENVYVDQVSQVTRQAEDQWNKDHPDFERIRTNIVDNDYRNLVKVYLNVGLNIPDAFCNTLIAIVRQYGSPSGDSYSIDRTFGQFSDFVETDIMSDEYRSDLILDAMYKLKDEYGVTFSPTIPASEEEGEKQFTISLSTHAMPVYADTDSTVATATKSDEKVTPIITNNNDTETEEELIEVEDDDEDFIDIDDDDDDELGAIFG